MPDSESKLIDGKIPAFTECPFTKECDPCVCNHHGINHKVAFSCAFARAFDMLNQRKKSHATIN